MKSLVVALACGLMTFPAAAAPFCLAIQGATPICAYYDGTQCAKDAARQNGACQPNPAEAAPQVGSMGTYCMITPTGYQRCNYADGISCQRDAQMQKGICSKSAGTGPKQVPDIYAPNAGR